MTEGRPRARINPSPHLQPGTVGMERVLVVNDDRSTRELIRLQLKQGGYRVDTAASGATALKRLEGHDYDLMLLDIRMPGIDGLGVLKKMRSFSRRPKVIVMTADDTPETLFEAIREHTQRYLKKPLELELLTSLVREVLDSGEIPPIEVVSAKADWVELLVPCDRKAVDQIHDFMTNLDTDLPREVRHNVAQAFRELLMNAVEWGGRLDPTQRVRIAYLRAGRMLLYRIADPGHGFSFESLEHAAVSNPPDDPMQHSYVRQEKGIRPGGFGLLLTRSSVDELLYNEAQNEVVFVKYLD